MRNNVIFGEVVAQAIWLKNVGVFGDKKLRFCLLAICLLVQWLLSLSLSRFALLYLHFGLCFAFDFPYVYFVVKRGGILWICY